MAERDGSVKGAKGGDDGIEGKILTGLWGVGCWVILMGTVISVGLCWAVDLVCDV